MDTTQLRKRRERIKLDVSAVSSLARLEPTRVKAIEAGATPSIAEVEALARALAFDAPEFLSGAVVEDDPRRQVARFRAQRGADLAPLDVRLLARAGQLARAGAELRDRLGLAPSRLDSLRQVRAVRASRKLAAFGSSLGRNARLALSPDPTPLQSVHAALETWGVHVAFVDFTRPEVYAVSLYEPGAVPVILLNQRASRVQNKLSRRAVLAHELCHLLHDGSKDSELLTLVSQREDGAAFEKRANAFAPSFLAPREWVEAHGHTAEEIVRNLASEWGFTIEGAAWHAKHLELVETADADRLARTRERVTPPFPVEQPPRRADDSAVDAEERSSLAHGLIGDWAVLAASRSLVSAGRARELLRFA